MKKKNEEITKLQYITFKYVIETEFQNLKKKLMNLRIMRHSNKIP